MVNERRQTEILYLSELVFALCESCTDNPQAKEAAKVMLEHAAIPRDKQGKLHRRVSRMMRVTLMRIREGTDGEKVVIIVYCFFELLAEEGIIEIPEESPATQIMDWLLSGIDVESAITQKRLKNGRKDAAKWLETLQQRGYFPW